MSCKCWKTRDDTLRQRYGLKVADVCSALLLDDATLSLRGAYCLPLERVDGKKLKRSDPKFIEITYCPFCGKKLNDESRGQSKSRRSSALQNRSDRNDRSRT